MWVDDLSSVWAVESPCAAMSVYVERLTEAPRVTMRTAVQPLAARVRYEVLVDGRVVWSKGERGIGQRIKYRHLFLRDQEVEARRQANRLGRSS